MSDSRPRKDSLFQVIKTFSLPTNAHWAFGISFLVLLAVGIGSLAQSPWFDLPPKPQGDGLEYENLAFHLSRGYGFQFNNQDPEWRSVFEKASIPSGTGWQAGVGGYATHLESAPRKLAFTGRPPLLSVIISIIYLVFDRGPVGFATVRIFSAVCLALGGGLATAHATLIASKICLTTTAGKRRVFVAVASLATLVFYGSNRTLWSYAEDFLTEPLALLLTQILVGLLLWLAASSQVRSASHSSSPRWLLACGACVGLMILSRSIFVLWIPGIWVLIAAMPGPSIKQGLVRASFAIAIAALVCSPWWVRNVVVLQAFQPLGTQGSIAMLGGYSDAARKSDGEWQYAPELKLRTELESDPRWQQLPNDSHRELYVSRRAGVLVRKWIREHVDAIPAMAVGRIKTHWNPYFGRSLIWKLSIVAGLVWLVVASRRRGDSSGQHNEQANVFSRSVLWLAFGLPILSTLVTAATYSVGGRFLVPLYGWLSTLAGLGIAGCLMGISQALFHSFQHAYRRPDNNR